MVTFGSLGSIGLCWDKVQGLVFEVDFDTVLAFRGFRLLAALVEWFGPAFGCSDILFDPRLRLEVEGSI